MSGSSLALSNLRGIVILIVVAFHAWAAYLGSLTSGEYAFDKPPYLWRAFPIVDNHHWFGFDILCAWQDVYLMCLMFFLSALFAWPSLGRKGTSRFLADRFRRLGVPCIFGMIVMMPLAVYPVYRTTASDPGVGAYIRHLFALPFWPNGPMWFLWQLLALTALAAALHRFAPRVVNVIAGRSIAADKHPGRYFAGLTAAAIAAYVPLALIFTPMRWSNVEIIPLQLCRPLLYVVAYLAGLGMGACGLERGLLAPDGMLVRHWRRWLAGAFLTYCAWMGLTAWSMHLGPSSPLVLDVTMDVSFALAAIAGCFGALALCLRFGQIRSRLLDNLSENAFGIFALHYPFVVWLQYALLGTALFAIAKGLIVFTGALLLTWGLVLAMRASRYTSVLIGGERRMTAKTPRPAPDTRYIGEPAGRLSHIAR